MAAIVQLMPNQWPRLLWTVVSPGGSRHERSVLDPEAVAFAARLYAELTAASP